MSILPAYRFVLGSFLLLALAAAGYAQGKPIPPLPDSVTKYLGTHIPKTMQKLKAGEQVRVVFFGQSLTDDGNAWVHNLCDWLKKTYPKADVVYVQRSLAGHASDALGPKVQAQLGGQNPTLVIFQCFSNGPESYETVVKNMLAAAPNSEFLIWSTHVMQDMPKAREWFERWEGNLLPQMCEKYKLGFLNVYMASRAYLKANYGDEWKWNQICADGVHLNPEGQWLLLELMKQYFKPRDAAAPSTAPATGAQPQTAEPTSAASQTSNRDSASSRPSTKGAPQMQDKPPMIIDDFESYKPGEGLPWHKAPHGNQVKVEVGPGISGKGHQSMKLTYMIQPDPANSYVAIMWYRKFDLSGCNALSFWIKPDGHGHSVGLTLNMLDDQGRQHWNLWNASFDKLQTQPGETEARRVIVPFSCLKQDLTYSPIKDVSNVFKPSNVTEIVILPGLWHGQKGGYGEAVLYIDDIEAVSIDAP